MTYRVFERRWDIDCLYMYDFEGDIYFGPTQSETLVKERCSDGFLTWLYEPTQAHFNVTGLFSGSLFKEWRNTATNSMVHALVYCQLIIVDSFDGKRMYRVLENTSARPALRSGVVLLRTYRVKFMLGLQGNQFEN